MVTTTATSAATTAANGTTNVTSKTTLANNFNTFLSLLTTQLKNQSPLDPLDTNQFTQQLVQFAGVEQQMNTNSSLTSLLTAIQSSQTSATLGYLGRTITYDASSATPSGNGASWNFTPTQDGAVTMRVRDSSGNYVFSTQQNLTAGKATAFNWTQGRNDGAAIGSNPYTLEVVMGSTNLPVTGQGDVSTVSFENGDTLLTVNNTKVSASKVKSVTAS